MASRLPTFPATRAPWASDSDGTEEGDQEELEEGDIMGDMKAA